MTYFKGLPKVVSWDKECITVVDGIQNRITFYYPPGDIDYKLRCVNRAVMRRNEKTAWHHLRSCADSIVEHDAMKMSPPGEYVAQILDAVSTPYGIKVKIKAGEKEDLMAKHDSRNYPDKDYRFTAIAPVAQSLTYHGQRQWFKTKAACKAFCEEIFGKEHPKSFVLAIVEAKDLIEPKKKIDTVITSLAK